MPRPCATSPWRRSLSAASSETRRPIAAICHGGWLLISAHLVKGRHLTSYKAIKDDFTQRRSVLV